MAGFIYKDKDVTVFPMLYITTIVFGKIKKKIIFLKTSSSAFADIMSNNKKW